MNCDCIIGALMLTTTLIGFGFTYYGIIKNRKSSQIQNILRLKKQLLDFETIHAKLLPGGEWSNPDFSLETDITNSDFSLLNAYLGFFEVCFLMINEKELTEKEFRIFLLYRLKNIFYNKSIMNYINTHPHDWHVLLKLFEKFQLKTTQTPL
ncbi:hypothetical protein [Gaetbulibacter jejuensis]|uniref:hypothetical protein n=1 Tax=Gaetbulibacter jejuensis TaxID=584607 RepID=UPI00300ADFF7